MMGSEEIGMERALKKFVRLWHCGSSYVDTAENIATHLAATLEEVENMSAGERYELEIVEMTQEEFDALPEFTGF